MGKKNFLKQALSQEKQKLKMRKGRKGWVVKGITLISIFVLGSASPIDVVLATSESSLNETVEVEKTEPTDSIDTVDEVIESENIETLDGAQTTEDSQVKIDVNTEKETKAVEISKAENPTNSVQKTNEKNLTLTKLSYK